MTLTIVNVTNVNEQLRGYITRFLMEVYTGSYIGTCSQRVREQLWQRVVDSIDDRHIGSAMIAWATDNEQGYDLLVHGFNDRDVCDDDGIHEIIHHNRFEAPTSSGKRTRHWSKAYFYRHK
jgi:CRISPR-associated protein Cas2